MSEPQVEPQIKVMTLAELFSDPSRWIQGFFQKDADGNKVDNDNPRACKFCLAGGLKVLNPDFYVYQEKRRRLIDAIIKQKGKFTSLAAYNDAATYEEVMFVVREAGV